MRGYIAITTVLIVGFFVAVIGLTTTLTSVNQTQFSLNNNFKTVNLSLVESCLDEALIKLNLNNILPTSINLPQGSCNLTLNSNVGTSWVFTVTGSSNYVTNSIQVGLTRGSVIQINSWQEF